jgi:hypothetical protein
MEHGPGARNLHRIKPERESSDEKNKLKTRFTANYLVARAFPYPEVGFQSFFDAAS